MMADSQLLVNYRGSRWVGEDATPVDGLGSPRPGDRAPEVQGLGRHFVARPIRLFELMRGVGHTLLFYADESAGERDFEALAAIADELSTGYPGAVAPYAVVSPGARPLDLERVPLIVDARGGFRSAYGARRLRVLDPTGWLPRLSRRDRRAGAARLARAPRARPTRPLGRGALIAWWIGRATRRRRSRPRRGRMGAGRCCARERRS